MEDWIDHCTTTKYHHLTFQSGATGPQNGEPVIQFRSAFVGGAFLPFPLGHLGLEPARSSWRALR